MADIRRIGSVMAGRHERYGARDNLPGRGDDWQESAACLGDENPDAWWPEGRHTPRNESMRAKKLCLACPVAQQCFDMAMASEEREGIWGGVDFRIGFGLGRKKAIRALKDARRRLIRPRAGSHIKSLERLAIEQRAVLDQIVKEAQT